MLPKRILNIYQNLIKKQSQVAITTDIMVLCKALLVLKGYAQRNLSLKSIECNATVRDSQIIQFNILSKHTIME